jgi:hypothetical protein
MQMALKLARTIRFDSSDLNIFDSASEEGEWAISGSFMFAGISDDALVGKTRQAFANGFVGLSSFGFSTLVTVASASDEMREALIQTLAGRFVEEFGAPSHHDAEQAAREEIDFMADICSEHKTGTLLSITRSLSEQGIKESFRSIAKADSCAEQQIWTIIDDEEERPV